MQYNLRMPKNVAFGWGRRNELGDHIAVLGRRAFVVTGSRSLRRSGVIEELLTTIREAGVEVVEAGEITTEPTIEDVDRLAAAVRESDPNPSGDVVVGIGGGAALDMAKALAARATNHAGGSVRDYLEGVGCGRTLSEPPLPVVAMPTTAGTGSEATKNAVLSCADPPCKKSLRADELVPAAVVIDPELTVTCPASVTAASGMDAITQLIESAISCRAQPFTRALCRETIPPAIEALPRAYRDPSDREARETMAHAAFVSGIALANSGLGVAHGVAAALGAICDVPHGLACAAMLPIALAANREVCEAEYAALGLRLGISVTESDAERADGFVEQVCELGRALGIPERLRDLGVRSDQLSALAHGARGNSLRGNPRALEETDVLALLETAW